MKPKLAILLDEAAWPAFLVDRRGTIRHANDSARNLFGETLNGPSPKLSDIWSIENATKPEQFISEWWQTQTPTATLKFKPPQTRAEAYTATLCATDSGEDCVVFQLLPLNGHSTAEPKLALERQKLERAFQLARTLTLDFNNALTGILGNASLLLSRMEPDHPHRALLVELEKSAQRAVEIASDLGTFSRQERDHPGSVAGNLNSVVVRTLEAVRQSTVHLDKIEWEVQPEKRLFAVKFEENRLQPALVKVLENAAESLRKNRSIVIATRNVELTEASQDRNARLSAGNYVCIEVKDTGCGIADDVLPRVFEPFFTTKHGNHRGLGLALAYGIVTNLGGVIAVSSQPQVGTSVRIYLPASTAFVEADPAPGAAYGDGQTVLVVDDEELLLTMEQAILSSGGYNVISANTGEKALKILQQRAGEIKLVVTDLIMPTMSGKELIERVRQNYPGVRVLCTTGYVWPPGQQPRDEEYLRKPFTSQQLLSKVAGILRRE